MKRFVPEQYGITSLAEAEKFAELTDRIVVNLKAIEEGETDIVDLFQTTNAIAGNLQVIDNDCKRVNRVQEMSSVRIGGDTPGTLQIDQNCSSILGECFGAVIRPPTSMMAARMDGNLPLYYQEISAAAR